MKSITRYLIPAAGLAAFLPAVLLAQDAPPPEKKEMRVLVGPGGPGGSGGPGDNAPPHHLRRVMMGHPHEMETITFLGVETRPADSTLADQLNLPSGAGLIVRNVAPMSPAAEILKKNDVLTKLDDQLLIEQRQLAVLIRNHKDGDEVSLTFIRGGKETTVKVKLAKHDVPKMTMLEGLQGGNMAFALAGADAEAIPGMGREEADRVLSLIDRGEQGGPGERTFNLQVEPGNGPGMRNISVNTSNSNMVFSDNDGSLDLTIKDGKKTLVAKNAKGESLFSGPVNTPEERKAMPADVLARLDKLEAMQDFSFKTDGDFQPGEVKDVRPHHQGIALPLPPRAPGGRPPAFF